MAYTAIPQESKTNINKAGEFLTQATYSTIGYQEALDLANRWRACHAYPINTFQATLRTKLKDYKGSPIVAQRLKRMPTVIDKLKRHPNMKLTTMQDIAGVRGIVEDIEDVYRIVKAYEENKNFPHDFVQKFDYVNTPRNADGYRSVHLVYKYVNKAYPNYDGLKVEIQIRTKLQHIWATAVETMGTFIGQALKTRQGDKEWLDFFAMVSEGFARIEGSSSLPRFTNLSHDEVYQTIASEERKLSVLDKMKSFSTVAINMGNNKAHAFHLITINYASKEVSVVSYNRDNYQQALLDYNQAEAKMPDNVDIALVSAGKIDTLKKAYPNLFLDLNEFEIHLHSMIAKGS